MKYLKLSGLVLFVLGFALFNFSFFGSDYRITEALIEQKVGDTTKARLLKAELSESLNKSTSSVFEFVSTLKNSFGRVNETQLLRYQITEVEQEKIKMRSPEAFFISAIDSIFSGTDDVVAFKQKAFRDYGSWLEGQSVSPEQLRSVADNIKAYAIINQFGFDRYG
jgi:hypothetical protein